ncbi:LexA family transcriptional regulator [Frischella sp. Ac13]|uniref:LexA family transcriptional regulator n=1 Tax=Frischella japonica TaxID=2741544 RepID=A0ABR7R0A6_9GAMM|nr:XRE family transcriptional regulator [Frischella japonica]MBC9131643.1 LexA family transcriptional regulator [Frischella japonica]
MRTNKSVQNFKHRLAEIMQNNSIASFAKKCDMSETVIRDYLSGKTYPSLNRLAIIAEKCDVTYTWLATGYNPQDIDLLEDSQNYNDPIYRIPVYSKQCPTPEEASTQKYVRGTPPVMNYPVLAGWLGYRGLNAEKLIIYWAKGNMMAPDIKNNNGLIIDTTPKDIVDGNIYLIEYLDITMVRRIQITLEGWVLLANNPQCEAIVVHRHDFNSYHIVGNVVQIIKDLY